MAIVYSKKGGELVYYVYKFRKPLYGVSVTHRNGDTSLVSDFSSKLPEAVGFVDFIFDEHIRPPQLQKAVEEYKSAKSCFLK